MEAVALSTVRVVGGKAFWAWMVITLLLAAHPAQGVEEEVLVAAGHHLVGGIIQQGGGGYPHDIGLSVVVNLGGDRHGQGEGPSTSPSSLLKVVSPIVDLLGEGGGGGEDLRPVRDGIWERNCDQADGI